MPDQIPSAPGPSTPLTESYTYHSKLPTAAGPYILGVDEAGRGPVLGPLVYGVAYCPVAYKEQLEELGFADSKTLTPEIRSTLLTTLDSDPDNLAWSVQVISPQAISSGMLRRPPINLNVQSQDATILLIREVYVDALGSTTTYQAYLSGLFPGIEFTVTNQADSKFKVVGAASVAAKVTRDACLESWVFEESIAEDGTPVSGLPEAAVSSGYPSDPKTQAWLKNSIEPTFGYPKLVRFSWTTVKLLLEKNAHAVKWTDEGQASLVKAFESGKGREKDRCAVAKDLKIVSVGML
ncbi:hypothetical protein D9615_004337 [Tricholomella constricta]|uniref:Ribonuclease n=1 Tax=Tricholomella constricta TaxID=117010 RepID=A0A8H5HF79_9AGAR|nr:hypothetical protein D9615_004337 [Tricholomella constricta]